MALGHALRYFGVAFCLLIVGTTVSAQEDEAPLMMWEVTSDTNTVYLLGSIHLGSPDFYPMDPAIEAAFEEASKLVVEADISDPAVVEETQALVLQEGMYPEGETLWQNISDDTADSLNAFCSVLELPSCNEAFASQEPWLAVLSAGVMPLMVNGFDLESGIDTYFLNKARGTGKEIVEIEDATWQISLFTEESPEAMEAYLKESVDYVVDNPDYPQTWAELYVAGDVAGMEAAISESYDASDDFSQKLLQDRNPGMAEVVEDNLEAAEPAFVMVGIAHLLGDGSVIELLEEQGYEVTQVRGEG